MDLFRDSQAALAALAAALSVAGLLFSLGGYVSFFLFIGSLDSSISPQIESAEAAVVGTGEILSGAEESASSASQGLSEVSGALSAYSESTLGMADSLSSVAAIPPFSLDSRLSSAAGKLREASGLFASASAHLNNSSSSILNATGSLRSTAGDLSKAKGSLGQAKALFKDALSKLHLVALAMALALALLFSSVFSLSLSVLLPHYPRLFSKKEKDEGEKKPHEENE